MIITIEEPTHMNNMMITNANKLNSLNHLGKNTNLNTNNLLPISYINLMNNTTSNASNISKESININSNESNKKILGKLKQQATIKSNQSNSPNGSPFKTNTGSFIKISLNNGKEAYLGHANSQDNNEQVETFVNNEMNDGDNGNLINLSQKRFSHEIMNMDRIHTGNFNTVNVSLTPRNTNFMLNSPLNIPLLKDKIEYYDLIPMLLDKESLAKIEKIKLQSCKIFAITL